MKTNRQARRLLGMDRWISNLRKIVIKDEVEVIYQRRFSRKQRQRRRQQTHMENK